MDYASLWQLVGRTPTYGVYGALGLVILTIGSTREIL